VEDASDIGYPPIEEGILKLRVEGRDEGVEGFEEGSADPRRTPVAAREIFEMVESDDGEQDVIEQSEELTIR
jgi:hypothetical protein